MTHEFIFTSDKIIDYYTPDKFNKYYWLAWMLYPDSPKEWDSTANKYKELIPVGYPIFEYGRRLSSRKFIPDMKYVDYVIEQYNKDERQINYIGNTGVYETEEEFHDYIHWEVCECKKVLEEKLKKEIHTLCFPGGGYTDYVLDVANECGYKCFMNASRLRNGNNNEHIKHLYDGKFVGLNRTAFSLIHPGVLPDSFFDYWVAKLSMGMYQNKPLYKFLKKALSRFV